LMVVESEDCSWRTIECCGLAINSVKQCKTKLFEDRKAVGKRGPKAKQKSVLKSAPVSFRFTVGLRHKLETAARENGRTMSQEAERRLAESLREDGGGISHSPQTRALVQLMAEAISMVEQWTYKRWHTDRFTYDILRKTIDILLIDAMPKGKRRVPSEFPLCLQPKIARLLLRRTLLSEPGLVAVVISSFISQKTRVSAAYPSEIVSKPHAEAARYLSKHLPGLAAPPDFAMPKTTVLETKNRRRRK
jgi:hypothetical protein